MADGDSKRNKKVQRKSFRNFENIINNVGNVLQSIWVRLAIQNGARFDRLILENRFGLLFHFNSVLFVIFLLKLKK